MKKVLAVFIFQTIFLIVIAHISGILISAAEEARSMSDYTQYMTVVTLKRLVILISCISVGVSSVLISKMRPPLRKIRGAARAGYILLLAFTAVMMLYPLLMIHVYPVYAVLIATHLQLFGTQADFTYLYGALFVAMLFPKKND